MSEEEIRAQEEATEAAAEAATKAEPTAEEAAEVRVLEIESAAGEKGWKPESDYDGPQGGFVGADEFLKREPLFDRIRDLSRNNKKLEKSVAAMVSQFSSQVKAQVALRTKELQSAKKVAIKEGDVETVEQIDAELDQHKTAAVDAPEVPNEASEWIAKNDWFVNDQELSSFAIAHNREYIRKTGAGVEESLKATEKAVKKAFPEKFETKPKPEPTPSPVAGAGTPKDPAGSKGYSMSRLSADQKSVYQQMVKQHKVLSHEEYFKGLEEIGELA